jgi:uncharacterized protein (DUF983 family)
MSTDPEPAPRPRATPAVMVARALRRRCPSCGGGALFRGWIHPVPACPRCRLRLDRGEHDHFLGAYAINFIVAELLLVAFLVGLAVATWPDVPWRFIQFGGAALMVLMPIVFYPFARTLWLAIDLILQPPRPQDFEGAG